MPPGKAPPLPSLAAMKFSRELDAGGLENLGSSPASGENSYFSLFITSSTENNLNNCEWDAIITACRFVGMEESSSILKKRWTPAVVTGFLEDGNGNGTDYEERSVGGINEVRERLEEDYRCLVEIFLAVCGHLHHDKYFDRDCHQFRRSLSAEGIVYDHDIFRHFRQYSGNDDLNVLLLEQEVQKIAIGTARKIRKNGTGKKILDLVPILLALRHNSLPHCLRLGSVAADLFPVLGA